MADGHVRPPDRRSGMRPAVASAMAEDSIQPQDQAPRASAPSYAPRSDDLVEAEGIALPASAPQPPCPDRPAEPSVTHAAGSADPVVDVPQLGKDALQPAALLVGFMFIAYAIANWLTFPVGAREPACLYDLALVGFGFAMYQVCRRVPLSDRGVHLLSFALALSVLGNILFTAWLGVNPEFSFYVGLLMIASANVIGPAWAIAISVIEIAAWVPVAYVVLPGRELTRSALVMMASAVVTTIVHVARARARKRIAMLRAGDAKRAIDLQLALAEADEARRELDRKVEERTAALRTELDERQRLEEQLRHVQKLEAVGRLAGGIAHDFNNLLTVIRLSHNTLGEAALPTEMRDALRDASGAADRAAGLTHDLLAFARKQTLQRADVAIAGIVGDVERMIRRVAEAGIRLETAIASDAGGVHADRYQIEQVLLNLAINACDAMGRRGTPTISASAVELGELEAARRSLRPGGYVRIAVTDTGTGMDDATQRSVFEPFFTTKEVGRGTGLGLAMAHGIVTQHGGQIDVESELGKGSTFTVLLPRVAPAATSTAIAGSQPVPALARESLLVVEDEAVVRRAVQRQLERLGYRVIVAQDGEDALRVAETLDNIDLLLTDVVMPGLDGPELACRLRERWSDLPVLFVTGYSADRLTRSGAVTTQDRVLEKPYQVVELTQTIRQMMDARPSHAGHAQTPAS